MIRTTTFQNGQTLTSTALVPSDMDSIFQLLATQLLGITANLQFLCTLQVNSPTLATPFLPDNIAVGFKVLGIGIPAGTTIQSLQGNGANLLITLTNPVTAAGDALVSFFDPTADTRVRLSWQTEGAPAYGISDDVLFIRCTEEGTDYIVRDEVISSITDTYINKQRVYTRVWNVFFRARGPNSFDSIRLIKSMLLEDFSHDTLALSNLYLVTAMGTPVRAPELFEGQWWEQVDFNAQFNEQVTETINVPRVTSVELIGITTKGTVFDTTVANRS